jgi:hypothetical protein
MHSSKLLLVAWSDDVYFLFFFFLYAFAIRYDTRNQCLYSDYSPWLGQRMAFGDICNCTSPDAST